MINVRGDKLTVDFERFTLKEYDVFLKCKTIPDALVEYDDRRETYRIVAPARYAVLFGLQAPAIPVTNLELPRHLFDYQRARVLAALANKRDAEWWRPGMGKTPLGLEWCRQVAHKSGGGRVLILTLKELIAEMLEQNQQFYGDKLKITVLRKRADVVAFCQGPHDGAIGLSNYEKFNDQDDNKNSGMIQELKWLAGLWADESSCLKSGGGVRKWNLIKSARGIEYKLSTTATPAPNDIMEYASQAAFLEKLRNEGEILWTYFSKNKKNEWHVKPNAIKAFYRWMSTWSFFLQNPGHYGFKDNVIPTPGIELIEHRLTATPQQIEWAQHWLRITSHSMLDDNIGVVPRTKLSQIAKGFVYLDGKTNLKRIPSRKPALVADLCRREIAAGRKILLWTVFDEETKILQELLAGPGTETITGSIRPDDRRPIINRFKRGATNVLITRADLLGFGQNFQCATAQTHSGFTDSYEDFYQAVCRSDRYGQKQRVQIHVPYVPELEGAVWDNLQRKARNFARDAEQQEEHYIRATAELTGAVK